jgi:hypothetical protein
VSLTVANEQASLPVAHRLFLPQSWACDRERRRKAKVPEGIVFQAKTEIALGLPGQFTKYTYVAATGLAWRRGTARVQLTAKR